MKYKDSNRYEQRYARLQHLKEQRIAKKALVNEGWFKNLIHNFFFKLFSTNYINANWEGGYNWQKTKVTDTNTEISYNVLKSLEQYYQVMASVDVAGLKKANSGFMSWLERNADSFLSKITKGILNDPSKLSSVVEFNKKVYPQLAKLNNQIKVFFDTCNETEPANAAAEATNTKSHVGFRMVMEETPDNSEHWLVANNCLPKEQLQGEYLDAQKELLADVLKSAQAEISSIGEQISSAKTKITNGDTSSGTEGEIDDLSKQLASATIHLYWVKQLIDDPNVFGTESDPTLPTEDKQELDKAMQNQEVAKDVAKASEDIKQVKELLDGASKTSGDNATKENDGKPNVELDDNPPTNTIKWQGGRPSATMNNTYIAENSLLRAMCYFDGMYSQLLNGTFGDEKISIFDVEPKLVSMLSAIGKQISTIMRFCQSSSAFGSLKESTMDDLIKGKQMIKESLEIEDFARNEGQSSLDKARALFLKLHEFDMDDEEVLDLDGKGSEDANKEKELPTDDHFDAPARDRINIEGAETLSMEEQLFKLRNMFLKPQSVDKTQMVAEAPGDDAPASDDTAPAAAPEMSVSAMTGETPPAGNDGGNAAPAPAAGGDSATGADPGAGGAADADPFADAAGGADADPFAAGDDAGGSDPFADSGAGGGAADPFADDDNASAPRDDGADPFAATDDASGETAPDASTDTESDGEQTTPDEAPVDVDAQGNETNKYDIGVTKAYNDADDFELSEDEQKEFFGKIDLLCKIPDMDNFGKYLYQINPENVNLDDVHYITNLYDLSVKLGLLTDEYEDSRLLSKYNNYTYAVAKTDDEGNTTLHEATQHEWVPGDKPVIIDLTIKNLKDYLKNTIKYENALSPEIQDFFGPMGWIVTFKADYYCTPKYDSIYVKKDGPKAAKEQCTEYLKKIGYTDIEIVNMEEVDPYDVLAHEYRGMKRLTNLYTDKYINKGLSESRKQVLPEDVQLDIHRMINKVNKEIRNTKQFDFYRDLGVSKAYIDPQEFCACYCGCHDDGLGEKVYNFKIDNNDGTLSRMMFSSLNGKLQKYMGSFSEKYALSMVGSKSDKVFTISFTRNTLNDVPYNLGTMVDDCVGSEDPLDF